jgi:N-acyl-D-amino-acid deacylase
LDIIIRNGRLIDGTGNPWFKGDIGIKEKKISKITTRNIEAIDSNTKIIDAKNLIVSPGFIDIHTHSDLAPLTDKSAYNYLTQGVTTNVIGNCGFSPAPINKNTMGDLLSLVDPNLNIDLTSLWRSYGDFLDFFESGRFSLNFIPLVGHGTIRISVMGVEERAPTQKEMEEMKNLTRESMKSGAYGMSAGLEYIPGLCSKREELIELCKIVGKYHGIFTIHIRNEGDLAIDATNEAIEIAKRANVPLELSHVKIDGKRNWGYAHERLDLIEKARLEGLDVTGDVYPYTFCMTGLHALFPQWFISEGIENIHEKLLIPKIQKKLKEHFKNGTSSLAPRTEEDWNLIILTNSNNPQYKGKSILQISKENQKNILETLSKIIKIDGLSSYIILNCMDEQDVEDFAKDPFIMVGSDGMVHRKDDDKGHPRHFGTYPRFLRLFVREKQLMTLEEAIRKMTSFPAQKLGIHDRGILRENNYADVTIFDPKTITDNATMMEPNKLSEGVKFVIINGKLVLENGKFKRKYPGFLLRKNYGDQIK